MKRKTMFIGVVLGLFVAGVSLTSCENTNSDAATTEETSEEVNTENTATAEEEAHAHKHYQCPMKCEDDKVYEEEGTCPVCKMDLKEVEA